MYDDTSFSSLIWTCNCISGEPSLLVLTLDGARCYRKKFNILHMSGPPLYFDPTWR